MSSNDPEDDPPIAPQDLFPFDEMSTGETSSLLRRAQVVTGAPDRPQEKPQPELKPMTGAQLAFRPSAPPRSTPASGSTGVQSAFRPSAPQRPATGAQPAFKPSSGAQRPATGQQPAFKPTTSTQPAHRPGSGQHAAHKATTDLQPAFRPSAPPSSGKGGTAQFAQFKPSEPPEAAPPEVEEEPPVFDAERLQAQFRAMSLTDSALGRAAKGTPKPSKMPASAVEDTFVKRKMKQAEEKVVDLDLDEDLG